MALGGWKGNRGLIRANRGFGIFAIIGIAKKCPKPLFFFLLECDLCVRGTFAAEFV